MARSVGQAIPNSIRPLFDGADLEAHEGLTLLLLTTTDAGWPHLAMLSVGEIVAVGARELRLALWLNSTATTNLARTGQATLALVHAEAGYSLRCTARRGADLHLERSGRLAFFALRVEDVLEDIAPYAVLDSGVRFHLKEPDQVLPHWRATVAALREAAPPAR